MSVSEASMATPVAPKASVENLGTRPATLPDFLQCKVLSFLPLSNSITFPAMNQGVRTVLYQDMINQKEKTIFPTVLRAFDARSALSVDLNRSLQGTPEWPPSVKAKRADNYVTTLIREERHGLTDMDWADIHVRRNRLTKLLTLQEKTRLFEKIAERKAMNLLSFFRDLSNHIPAAEQLLTQLDREDLHSPKTAVEKAERIRAWMRAHEAMLQTGDPIPYELHPFIPISPEIQFIFPRLSAQTQAGVIKRIASQENTAAFRALVEKYKNDPVLGPKVLTGIFDKSAEFGHISWMEELSGLPEFIALPQYVTMYGVGEPVDWFDVTLNTAVVIAKNEDIVELMETMGRTIEEETFRFLLSYTAAHSLWEPEGWTEVNGALRSWPQAAQIG